MTKDTLIKIGACVLGIALMVAFPLSMIAVPYFLWKFVTKGELF